MAASLHVLVVCTGNICRSPLGEVVVRRALDAAGMGSQVAVASAGTWDGHTGAAADPRTIAVAERRGYDLTHFRARGVRRADFTAFQLILGMTQGHVQELLAQRPRGSASTISRYLDFTPGLALRDVADPYTGTGADFEFALDRIEEGAAGVVAAARALLRGE